MGENINVFMQTNWKKCIILFHEILSFVKEFMFSDEDQKKHINNFWWAFVFLRDLSKLMIFLELQDKKLDRTEAMSIFLISIQIPKIVLFKINLKIVDIKILNHSTHRFLKTIGMRNKFKHWPQTNKSSSNNLSNFVNRITCMNKLKIWIIFLL
jgi:hypothetical protein